MRRVSVRVARWLPLVAAGTAVAVGLVLRFRTDSAIWLDEAISVEIARRPVPELLDALRSDGAPPLYYLLLHLWIGVFGDGDVAVRALSGLASAVALPLAWVLGQRVGRQSVGFSQADGRYVPQVATATLLLFATSPYAIRYASEARMYSLMVLLVVVFGLLLVRALERPGPRTAVPLTLATAALAYTHYWSFLLLATVALGLLLQIRRRPEQVRAWRTSLVAMLAAGLLFLPWLPSFGYQLLHTGTPWAPPVRPQVLLDTVFDWAGPDYQGAVLFLVLLFGAFLGLTSWPAADGRHLVLDLSGRAPGRFLTVLWLLPLALAYLLWLYSGSAYAERYTGVSLPAFLLLAGLGLGLLPSRRVRLTVLAMAAAAGLLGGHQLAGRERTQAVALAARLAEQSQPGDVVAYCPDQLAPALHRALVRRGVDTRVREMVFADAAGPALVDWVDYTERMRRASPSDFVAAVERTAGPERAVYLVQGERYRAVGDSCARIAEFLEASRGKPIVVAARQPLLEGARLLRYASR
jgi:mannosyltransferase